MAARWSISILYGDAGRWWAIYGIVIVMARRGGAIYGMIWAGGDNIPLIVTIIAGTVALRRYIFL